MKVQPRLMHGVTADGSAHAQEWREQDCMLLRALHCLKALLVQNNAQTMHTTTQVTTIV